MRWARGFAAGEQGGMTEWMVLAALGAGVVIAISDDLRAGGRSVGCAAGAQAAAMQDGLAEGALPP
ncbi:hypothetical protein E2L08_14725 [Palleronia sediminis]|uniref:Uncharacterized protein n=1 Tax=Palleronia sediminis TaxID=2547833 RepID=A0A4R6A219_9RHOB|nr:hypothetical protein [Palleronia sediminis]TDL75968.1 hypothetical protein E2L08_14725 [Palleronia sediminis]